MAVNSKFPKAVVPDERLAALMEDASENDLVQTMREIDRLKEIGLTIPEIAQTLGAVQRTSVRNLYDSKSRHAARKAIDQGCLNSLVIASEISEIILLELGNMKIRSLAGELNLTPEQIGTLQRSGEKAIEIARLMAGKDPSKLAPEKHGNSHQPSALDRARANLKALEGKASGLKPIVNPAAPVTEARAAKRAAQVEDDGEDEA